MGRVMYVTCALEHERPFMAPFVQVHDLPPAPLSAGSALLRCFLPSVPGGAGRAEASLCMRDADLSVVSSPESGRTGVGRADRYRRMAPVSLSGRFVGPVVVSVVQSGAEARKLPWVYEKSDKPWLHISTQEALAVLFSLMLFFFDVHPEPRTKVQVAPTRTDNCGNGSAPKQVDDVEISSQRGPFGYVSTIEAEVSSGIGPVRAPDGESGGRQAGQQVHEGLQPSLRVRDRPGDGSVDPPSQERVDERRSLSSAADHRDTTISLSLVPVRVSHVLDLFFRSCFSVGSVFSCAAVAACYRRADDA